MTFNPNIIGIYIPYFVPGFECIDYNLSIFAHTIAEEMAI